MDLIELTKINTDYENSKTDLKKVCSKCAKQIKARPFFLFDFAKRTGRNSADIAELHNNGELKDIFNAYYFK